MVGGVERYISELFIRSRLPVQVIAPDQPDAAEVDARMPFPVIRYAFRNEWQYGKRPLLPMASKALGALIRSRPTLIFSDQVQSGFVGLLLAGLARVPHVTFAYGLELNPTRLKRMKKWVFTRSSRVVAISRFTRDRLIDTYAIAPEKIALVPPGVDTDRFIVDPPARHRRRAILGASEHQVLLLTVGRLDASQPYKGYDRVIRTFARLADTRPQLRLLVVGDGTDRARLETIATDAGVGDRVHFLGAVDDETLREIYAAADVFVLASGATAPGALDVEGYGIVFAEAAASGLPSVGYRLGGATDAVQDGVSGFLTDPDENSFAATLGRIVDDGNLRRRISSDSRAHAERSLGWESSIAAFRAAVDVVDPASRSPDSSSQDHLDSANPSAN